MGVDRGIFDDGTTGITNDPTEDCMNVNFSSGVLVDDATPKKKLAGL